MIRVPIANEQTTLPIDEPRLQQAVRAVFEEASVVEAEVSVAVVDDPAMETLNRRYLDHDGPTDVLSFVLEQSEDRLEGQIVVSADTAQTAAARFGWPAEDELLLYVIHGALHLVGCDDDTVEEQAEMRRRERACLARFGLTPRWDELEAAEEAPRPMSEGEPHS
ncbi:MAG: rRNA maturation RNase YbeY [Pirellulaceae bacterium]|nr:rRNA maturation RNase YbeY [Pirellulaceae bacterium]